MKVHFSSETDLWATPQEFFDTLDKEFHFSLDACANMDNTKCALFYSQEDDGLSKNWHLDATTVWMNPPYGREISRWLAKANEQSKLGCTVVCLVPARTDTRWWHDYCIQHEVRFIKGRLKFGGHKNSAPFPSAVVIMRRTKTNEST